MLCELNKDYPNFFFFKVIFLSSAMSRCCKDVFSYVFLKVMV